MSETPKFDLSRIRVGNLADAVKPNGIPYQRKNTSDTVKADEITSEKTNSADTVKADEITSEKTNSAETAKANEITNQKTNSANAVKADKITGQKTETPDTVKAPEIANQKTKTLDTVKPDKPANQTTKLPSTEQKNITESAKEIQKLLVVLQATYPTKSDYEKQVFINKFREEIRKNVRVQEMLTSGGTELIKILCEPLDIPIDMGKKWLQTAQHYR